MTTWVLPLPLAFEPAVSRIDGSEELLAVRAASGGDHAAFERLYRRHVGRVYALVARLAGDRGEADRLTQDVFVRAWERLATFRGDSAFGTWLHRLAVNVFLADRRRTGRRERLFDEDDGSDERPTPGSLRSQPGLRLDLEQSISALPRGARAVFVLHDVEGYEHAEIASLLGIAVGTSKTQLFRARRLLREALDR